MKGSLALICVAGAVFFVAMSMVFGCTGAPVAEPIQKDICPACAIAPDCPADFGLEYKAAEESADSLEDALTAALERAEACEKSRVRIFEDGMRKGR